MSNKPSEMFLKTRAGRLIRMNTPEEEESIQRGIAADPDAREWTDEDFTRAKPSCEMLTALKNRGGRPKSAAPKVQTAIRFDPDVLARLKATGKGWQTRVNDAMREWLEAHSA
jgi:uncharacterized protein (DUF4415 family)